MEVSKTLFCSSKFPWASDIISSKFIDNLSKRPQKGSLALPYLHHREDISHVLGIKKEDIFGTNDFKKQDIETVTILLRKIPFFFFSGGFLNFMGMKFCMSPSLITFFNEIKLFRISIPKFPENFRRLTTTLYFVTRTVVV